MLPAIRSSSFVPSFIHLTLILSIHPSIPNHVWSSQTLVEPSSCTHIKVERKVKANVPSSTTSQSKAYQTDHVQLRGGQLRKKTGKTGEHRPSVIVISFSRNSLQPIRCRHHREVPEAEKQRRRRQSMSAKEKERSARTNFWVIRVRTEQEPPAERRYRLPRAPFTV